jgi:hypothetical protein
MNCVKILSTAHPQILKLCLHLTELFILIQGEEVDYRGTLHRDGSVLMSVSLDQLKVTFGRVFDCSLFCLSY